jgi:predicted transcriptional regulator
MMNKQFIVHWKNSSATDAVYAMQMSVVGNSVIFMENNKAIAIYNLSEILKVVKGV